MATVLNRNKMDFCFRYRRYSWRETFWDALASSLPQTLARAKGLAEVRIALFGNDGSIEGSPILERIVVSNDSVPGDSDQDTSFAKKTPGLAKQFAGKDAASPEFSMAWRTTNITGFARTRFLGGIPAYLLGLPAPHLDPGFYPAWLKFRKELGTNSWAYLLNGAGPNKNPDQRVSFIGFPVGTTVRVYSPVLPNAGQQIELRYTRFNQGSLLVKGLFKVGAIGPGWFTIDVGPAAPAVSYRSGGIWRIPVSRLINFDATSLLVGVTAHHRGFKLHSERGRSSKRRPQIF